MAREKDLYKALRKLLDAVGEYVDIACVKAGQWETLAYRGTWTVEN